MSNDEDKGCGILIGVFLIIGALGALAEAVTELLNTLGVILLFILKLAFGIGIIILIGWGLTKLYEYIRKRNNERKRLKSTIGKVEIEIENLQSQKDRLEKKMQFLNQKISSIVEKISTFNEINIRDNFYGEINLLKNNSSIYNALKSIHSLRIEKLEKIKKILVVQKEIDDTLKEVQPMEEVTNFQNSNSNIKFNIKYEYSSKIGDILNASNTRDEIIDLKSSMSFLSEIIQEELEMEELNFFNSESEITPENNTKNVKENEEYDKLILKELEKLKIEISNMNK